MSGLSVPRWSPDPNLRAKWEKPFGPDNYRASVSGCLCYKESQWVRGIEQTADEAVGLGLKFSLGSNHAPLCNTYCTYNFYGIRFLLVLLI